jgi:hypothetical protein
MIIKIFGDRGVKHMAALKDHDLRAILGDDYRAKQDAFDQASGLDAHERAALARINSLNNQKGPALYSAFVGLVLVAATKFSPTPAAATLQTYMGFGLSVGCVAIFFWLKHEVNKGQASAAA